MLERNENGNVVARTQEHVDEIVGLDRRMKVHFESKELPVVLGELATIHVSILQQRQNELSELSVNTKTVEQTDSQQ